MSAPTRKRTGLLVVFGVFVVGLFFVIASGVDLEGQGVVGHAQATASQGQEAAAPHAAEATHALGDRDNPAAAAPAKGKDAALAGLSCFGCHDLKAYHAGNKSKKRAASKDDEDDEDDDDSVIGKPFSHDLHAEEVGGHCHKCHAFKGHFEVVIREETCGECH
jgi:hypothetical protein